MDINKSWIVTISMISIISGIIESLLPDRKYKKLFRFVAATVLLYVFLQPVMGNKIINFNINDYLSDNYEVSESIDKFAQNAIVDSAEKAIEDMFLDFAGDNSITCKVKCKCSVVDNKIMVDNIYVSDCATKESEELIIDFAFNSGFDKSQLIFQGENYEDRRAD